MKKYLFSLFFLVTSVIAVFGQTEPATLSGKLILKHWSKTQQSYCAGGSDYYIVKAKNNKETVLDLTTMSKDLVTKSLNKKVTLTGTWLTEVKTNDDPMAQQPVNPPMCETFIVKSLK